MTLSVSTPSRYEFSRITHCVRPTTIGDQQEVLTKRQRPDAMYPLPDQAHVTSRRSAALPYVDAPAAKAIATNACTTQDNAFGEQASGEEPAICCLRQNESLGAVRRARSAARLGRVGGPDRAICRGMWWRVYEAWRGRDSML
jgi:hypothetical protein